MREWVLNSVHCVQPITFIMSQQLWVRSFFIGDCWCLQQSTSGLYSTKLHYLFTPVHKDKYNWTCLSLKVNLKVKLTGFKGARSHTTSDFRAICTLALTCKMTQIYNTLHNGLCTFNSIINNTKHFLQLKARKDVPLKDSHASSFTYMGVLI